MEDSVMSSRRQGMGRGGRGSNQYRVRSGGDRGPDRDVATACRTEEVFDVTGSGQVLTGLVTATDAASALTAAWKNGTLRRLVPELVGLERLGSGIGAARHKDQLWHTFRVVGQCEPGRERLRLAALFHDIAKPETRRVVNGEVTFRLHEERGAVIAERRLVALGYPDPVPAQVATLVRLSGRHKDSDNWSDSATRRLMTDAAELLDDLLALYRADCTTRHEWKFRQVQDQVDRIETAVARVRAADSVREAAHARVVTGDEIMARYGLSPGPQVGMLLKRLRDANVADREAAWRFLDVAVSEAQRT